jgi:hypothetical protein
MSQHYIVYNDRVCFTSFCVPRSVTLGLISYQHYRSRSDATAKYEVLLTTQSEQTFTHGAFNDRGDLLYAWAYGQGLDHLYVWRIEKGIISSKTDSEGHYPSVSIMTFAFWPRFDESLETTRRSRSPRDPLQFIPRMYCRSITEAFLPGANPKLSKRRQ